MKKRLITRHPVAELASLLLFGIFVLFLLLMLLFSARIYQQTVKNTNAENTLGTAVSYLTTKFRLKVFSPTNWIIFLPFVFVIH